MSFDYSMYEWRKHKEYYTDNNGVIEFTADTPAHVLKSYEKYCQQQQALNDFATRKDLERSKKIPFFQKKRKPDKNEQPTNGWLEALKSEDPLSQEWFSTTFVHIDENGKAQVGINELQKNDYTFEEMIEDPYKAFCIGKKKGTPCVIVVRFDENHKILQIQDYISKAR
ncbi:hypothetical protein C815_01624 [Firmicutes bacterium M10-2]|nr:hypothetical protein C815_01624 [Firmicutes bacterium M10-2]